MEAKDIMHPEDAKAIQMIRNIKGFDFAVKQMMKYGLEQKIRGNLLANSLRAEPRNHPELCSSLKKVVKKIGIAQPELFIINSSIVNAYAYGFTKPFIIITSSLLNTFTIKEVEFVLAHECGHILCRHSFYNTLLQCVLDLRESLGYISEAILSPLYLAFMYWRRRREFSADRCAACVVGERMSQQAILKLASGIPNTNVNPYQLVERAREYHNYKKESWWNMIQQNCNIAYDTHPLMCERAWEIDRWKNSWQYRKIRESI
jgi:Zn-dependent protease with chaperone function